MAVDMLVGRPQNWVRPYWLRLKLMVGSVGSGLPCLLTYVLPEPA